MIRELGDLNLYGGDLVEVAPPFDPTENMPLTGATLMFESSAWSHNHFHADNCLRAMVKVIWPMEARGLSCCCMKASSSPESPKVFIY